MKKEWYNRTVVQLIFHVAGWMAFIFLPNLIRPELMVGGKTVRPPFLVKESIASYLFLISLFYLNAYWLMPQFLNKKKAVYYVVSLVVILSFAVANNFIFNRPPEFGVQFFKGEISAGVPQGGRAFRTHFARPPLFPSLFLIVFVLALSTTYRFVLDRIRFNTLEQQRKTEHLKTELTFLRSQISPHFIFNILNSAVSLSRTGSDQLEPTLIKLSALMRYMLYGADDEKVPLTQEINYLENYIDLQRLRFGDDIPIEFNKTGAFFGYGIEPMLLIPFVENAFKHGVGNIDNPHISIQLELENGQLNFSVENSYDPYRKDVKDPTSGIGLNNVKKRLELLYSDSHTLNINESGQNFKILLKLKLR